MAGSAVFAYVAAGAVAVSGVGAAVVATRGDGAPAAQAHVWIDAPSDSSTLSPGTVTVQAHVTGTSFDSLVLSVDGAVVATDDSLDVDGSLAYGTFEWSAAAGTHELVVSDGDDASVPRFVTVVDLAQVPTPDDSTPTTSTTVAATSTSVGETTTTVASSTTVASATTVVPTIPVTTAPVTAAPTTTKPATPTTATTLPTTTTTLPIASVGIPVITPFELERCKGGSAVVAATVSVSNAASASLRLTGPGADLTVPMSVSVSGGTASASIDMAPYSNDGTFSVVVTASGPGGAATSSPATFRTICSIG